MEHRPAAKTRTFGWILLMVAGILLTIGSLTSVLVAYVWSNAPGMDLHIDQLRDTDQSLVTAAQGRRGTAASWATAYGLMLCFVSATAFRRGERWAWWAILVTAAVASLLVFLRIPLIGSRLGVGTVVALLAVVLTGLLVPVKNFFGD